MATINELRNYCKDLQIYREDIDLYKVSYEDKLVDLISILDNYFKVSYIQANKPWKAYDVEKWIEYSGIREFVKLYPDITEKELRSLFATLGYKVYFMGDDSRFYEYSGISIIPKFFKEDGKLSYAQNWVRRINRNYSEYCKFEIRFAREIFPEFLDELMKTPAKKIEVYEDRVVYRDFHFSIGPLSKQCLSKLKKILRENGIFQLFDKSDGHYIGIEVRL